MAQTILGIDIGSYSVKICELTRSLRDFELVQYYEQVIHANTRLTHEEAVASALRSILEKNDLKPDIVSMSLPSNHLSCRVLELPFTNLKKIEQTLEFELEGHIPVNLEDLLVDSHILSMDENRSTVLAAYVPRARFVKYLDILQVAGIDPKYVGVDCIDLSNISQIAMVPQDDVYTLLDIGHEKTNLCVMDGLNLLYARSITFGGLHFTRTIQKAFRLNQEKAESLKLDRGRVSAREDELDQISRLCQKVAEELIISIRQTYLGFKQIYPKKEWKAIYLSGGGARLQGLPELLSSALRMHVGTLDCLDYIPHRLSHADMCRDVIAPSLAQTLRVIFSNKAPKINFRRGEFAFHRDIKSLGVEIKQLGILFSIVLFLGLLHFSVTYFTLKSRVEKLNAGLAETTAKALPELKVSKKQSAKQLTTLLAGKISELNAQLEAIEGGASTNTPLQLLLEFSSKIPPKGEVQIDVDDFTFTGDQLRIEGRTVSFEAVDKVKSALAQSSYFKDVTTQNVAKGIRDEIKFSLSMDIAIPSNASGEGG